MVFAVLACLDEALEGYDEDVQKRDETRRIMYDREAWWQLLRNMACGVCRTKAYRKYCGNTFRKYCSACWKYCGSAPPPPRQRRLSSRPLGREEQPEVLEISTGDDETIGFEDIFGGEDSSMEWTCNPAAGVIGDPKRKSNQEEGNQQERERESEIIQGSEASGKNTSGAEQEEHANQPELHEDGNDVDISLSTNESGFASGLLAGSVDDGMDDSFPPELVQWLSALQLPEGKVTEVLKFLCSEDISFAEVEELKDLDNSDTATINAMLANAKRKNKARAIDHLYARGASGDKDSYGGKTL